MRLRRPRIKVCCIANKAEAQLAIHYGADVLGLVGQMPSGPGIIKDEAIREVAQFTPPAIDSFLLTQEVTAEKIIAHAKKTYTKSIQLVDQTTVETYRKIKQDLPYINIIQVIHVVNENAIIQAKECAPHVDALLLDSGNPNLAVKELGGTGRTHNWDISKRIVEEVDTPVFLAGGLSPENIQTAVKTVQPYGVDVCSGIRTNNLLDEQKLAAFFTALNETFTYTTH